MDGASRIDWFDVLKRGKLFVVLELGYRVLLTPLQLLCRDCCFRCLQDAYYPKKSMRQLQVFQSHLHIDFLANLLLALYFRHSCGLRR